MKQATFQRFLRAIRKRLYWWLVIHRKGIKEAWETALLGVGIIGLPTVMFLDWLIRGYGTTLREDLMIAVLLVIAARKLWRDEA